MLDEITSGIFTEVVLLVVGAVVPFVLYLALKFLPAQRQKMKMFQFFGIDTQDPKLTVYLSNIIVIEPFTTATFRIQTEQNQVVVGAYKGPTIAAGELNAIKPIIRSLSNDPLDEFPPFVRRWLEKRNHQFKYLQIALAASPPQKLPYPGFKFGPLIAVGSGTYNSISDCYAERCPGYLRFNTRPQYEFEVIRGSSKGEKIPLLNSEQSGTIAILERIIDDEHGTIAFIAAGSGVTGTVGAVQYLMLHWEDLAKKYGHKSFSGALHFDPNCSESPDKLEVIKQDWFPNL